MVAQLNRASPLGLERDQALRRLVRPALDEAETLMSEHVPVASARESPSSLVRPNPYLVALFHARAHPAQPTSRTAARKNPVDLSRRR